MQLNKLIKNADNLIQQKKTNKHLNKAFTFGQKPASELMENVTKYSTVASNNPEST